MGYGIRREVLRLMSRFTIRLRLVILSGVLLCVLIATNLYLMRTLAKRTRRPWQPRTELSSIIDVALTARALRSGKCAIGLPAWR